MVLGGLILASPINHSLQMEAVLKKAIRGFFLLVVTILALWWLLSLVANSTEAMP